ncbi:hypothetical protein [Pedobacter steynii]|nr:hypothetical protein [Pedobacter steynii]
MKATFILIFMSLNVFGQHQTEEQRRDITFYKATNNWFQAWKLVSKDIYHIETVRPVDFIFFDDKYVYTTDAALLKKGKPVKGPHLMNLSLKWKKELHQGHVTLPDESVIPIGLMSFAAEIPNKPNSSFFLMPLPDFWKSSGVESKELGLGNLVTGVFIHEFSHSQQMQNFGRKITEFEKKNSFPKEFNDDIVQNIFQKDTVYLKMYQNEVEKIYQSVQNGTLDKILANEGLGLINQRQNSYFEKQYADLKQIDDFFLTMEGLGQYSMYLWLIHPMGADIAPEMAIQGVRRGKKWWSQDEGLALFLVLDKMAKPESWAKEMFGDQVESVVSLIRQQIR